MSYLNPANAVAAEATHIGVASLTFADAKSLISRRAHTKGSHNPLRTCKPRSFKLQFRPQSVYQHDFVQGSMQSKPDKSTRVSGPNNRAVGSKYHSD